jgi:hypothetical protein
MEGGLLGKGLVLIVPASPGIGNLDLCHFRQRIKDARVQRANAAETRDANSQTGLSSCCAFHICLGLDNQRGPVSSP